MSPLLGLIGIGATELVIILVILGVLAAIVFLIIFLVGKSRKK